MASAVPLFFAGCYVGVLIMPHILLLMSSFVPDQEFASQFYEAAAYYDFAFKTVTVIGIAFVSPVFLVALNLAGIMSGMEILKAWRVAIIVATAFAAVSTPAADIASMLLLAGVLVVLYFGAVGISLLFDRRKRKGEQALLEAEA